MNNITSSVKKKGILFTFFILCSLYVCENAFSRNHWNRDFMSVGYDASEGIVEMRFEFYDYDFGPAGEDGFIEWCDFLYSTDGEHYYNLMRAETNDQSWIDGMSLYCWSWINMKDKLPGAQLQFYGCYKPESFSMWKDNVPTQRVEVDHYLYKVYLTMRWFLGTTYQDVKYIKMNGLWHHNGVWPHEKINNVVYEVPKPAMPALKSGLKSDSHQSENNAVKVYTEPGVVVIKGADMGENINVYAVSGEQIQSSVANNDIIKIKLPVNKFYIVTIGRARYKVAL